VLTAPVGNEESAPEIHRLQMLHIDLLELRNHDDFNAVFPISSVKELFEDKDKAGIFVRLDVVVLIDSFLSHAVPDEGVEEEVRPVVDGVTDFECLLEVAPGEVCGMCFKNAQAMRTHQRFSRAPGHLQRADAAKACKTNQCIWCKSAFASRQVAANHMKKALGKGYCVVGAATFLYDVVDLKSITCPFCDLDDFEELELYNEHVGCAHFKFRPTVFHLEEVEEDGRSLDAARANLDASMNSETTSRQRRRRAHDHATGEPHKNSRSGKQEMLQRGHHRTMYKDWERCGRRWTSA
jgi:hypothetical protein